MIYLFVYGTLKQGHRNNHYLEDQEFICEAETQPIYRLFDNSMFPMMIEDRDKGYSVEGEIWKVDEDMIGEIDDHEVLYHRKRIQVKNFKGPVWAYIYWGDLHQCQECYGMWG